VKFVVRLEQIDCRLVRHYLDLFPPNGEEIGPVQRPAVRLLIEVVLLRDDVAEQERVALKPEWPPLVEFDPFGYVLRSQQRQQVARVRKT
jgi:hypothetical protein